MRRSSSWDRRVCASIVNPYPACLARAASICGNADLRSICSWARSRSARQPAGRCARQPAGRCGAPASSGARQACGDSRPEDRRRVPRSHPSGEGLRSSAALNPKTVVLEDRATVAGGTEVARHVRIPAALRGHLQHTPVTRRRSRQRSLRRTAPLPRQRRPRPRLKRLPSRGGLPPRGATPSAFSVTLDRGGSP